MENNKNNKLLIGIIIGVLCSGIIFGGVIYSIYNNIENLVQNEDNKIDENENNNINDNNIKNISREKAQQIFDSIINKSSFMVIGDYVSKGQTLKVEDMSANFISRLISTTSRDSLKKVNICDAAYKQKLLELGIIIDGDGQLTCDTTDAYDSDSLKNASIKLFGKSIDKLFDSNNAAKIGEYYYYAQGNISVMPVFAGDIIYDVSMSTYYIEENVLTIEVVDNTSNQIDKLSFNIDDDNFYLASIGRL